MLRPRSGPVCDHRRTGGASRLAVALVTTTGLALVGVGAHNLVRVRALRRHAPAVAGARTHDATVGPRTGDALRLLVLGDSAADGFGIADAREAFPFRVASRLSEALDRRVEVASVAVSGAATADLLATQVPAVRAHAPDVLVLSVGVNDAVRRSPPASVRARTAALLDAVRAAAPAATTVLVTCPDLRTAPGIPRPLRDLLGWSCRRVARAQHAAASARGVPVAPLPARVDPTVYAADGFHPGPAGQDGMAAVAVAALLAAAPRSRHPVA